MKENKNILRDIWNTIKWTKIHIKGVLEVERTRKRGQSGRGLDWELGISRCKLVYIEWINHKVLLYSTGNYIQYPVISHNRKEFEKECVYIYIYIYINESLCYTAVINTTLCFNYTSIKKWIKNKNYKKRKRGQKTYSMK